MNAFKTEPRAAMAEAAREVRHWQEVLARTGDTVVDELLREHAPPAVWRHYPAGDVFDESTHAQYYYHRHPDIERPAGEVGHFHTFLRAAGMPDDVAPAVPPDPPDPADPLAGDAALSHLVGIGMDQAGRAVRLFTTNRWVTGETWYRADDVARLVDRFAIDHARPSWPLNRWMTAMLRLFRPQIVLLLAERDAAVLAHQRAFPEIDAFEDRALDVTSEMTISVEERIAAVEAAL